jgi:hypothetical protein
MGMTEPIPNNVTHRLDRLEPTLAGRTRSGINSGRL